MANSDEVLRQLDGFAFIREIFPEAKPPDQTSEVRFFCPFHDDKPNASASFNVETKLFRCFNCDAHGSAVDLVAKLTQCSRFVAVEYLARKLGVPTASAISPKIIEEHHSAFRLNAALLADLWNKKGIDADSVDRWRLGWIPKTQRLTIPVREEGGAVVNLRQYDLLKVHDEKKKYLNVKGHGQLRLWPMEAFQQDVIVLTEGELKMIGLVQRGFNAQTTTGGAAGWKDEWDRLYEGKRVYIVYDIDATGVARARALCRRLMKYATVHHVQLPMDVNVEKHGDVLDYFVKYSYTPQDFYNLLIGTPEYDPTTYQPGIRDDMTYEVDLASASKAQYYMRQVKAPVIVSAKDTSPYIAPKELSVNCGRDLEICQGCPVFTQPEESTWEVESDEPDLLALIDVPARIQDKELRAMIGIPTKCTSSDVVITETHNLEEIRLVPQLDMSGYAPDSSTEQVVSKAYHVGHGIETNATYSIEARVVANPKTQHATLLIYKAEPNVDNLSTFNPPPEEMEELKIFQPDEWSVDGIQRQLDRIYTDFESNVTRIYQRRNMHVLMDLTWHSVLYVTIGDAPAKGWLDTLVIGDSGQGKSETMSRLKEHYRLGEKVDMKSASIPGLKGGLDQTQKRWFVTWGVIVLSDRRLAILEEVKGASQEILQVLTDMRSSGVAELTKIERRRAWARTRLLWITNARSARSIETYNFGVNAVKELMGSLEDVRRFDAAIVVASNEVDRNVINEAILAPKTEHVYTSDLCRRLILWSWSRTPAQVVFEDDAKLACLQTADRHSARYSSAIPLVEPADHRLKIARLSAALAARTFSASDDGKSVVVRKCHVEWIEKYIDEIYCSKFMAYDVFSNIKQIDSSLANVKDITAAFKELSFSEETVRGMMRANEIRMGDIMDWSSLDKEEAKVFMSLLVRSNGLHRKGPGYYKTGAFIEFLKNIDINIDNGQAKEREAKSEY